MHWVGPSKKDTTNGTLDQRLWDDGDRFRGNSGLTPQKYSATVLGFIRTSGKVKSYYDDPHDATGCFLAA